MNLVDLIYLSIYLFIYIFDVLSLHRKFPQGGGLGRSVSSYPWLGTNLTHSFSHLPTLLSIIHPLLVHFTCFSLTLPPSTLLSYTPHKTIFITFSSCTNSVYRCDLPLLNSNMSWSLGRGSIF